MRITEIFFSIQGESSFAGLPCVFVRLTWCNLRCVWCDSEYTFTGGVEMSVDEVMERVRGYGCKLVEISGSLDASVLDPRAVKILDVKCPGSGEARRNHWANLESLNPRDEIKFVIKDRADFDYALGVIEKYRLNDREPYSLFSPVWGEVDLKDLAAWILESGARARMQLQLHKYIWGPDVKGV